VLVHAPALLVHEVALFGLHEVGQEGANTGAAWLGSLLLLAFPYALFLAIGGWLEIEVAHQVVRVEVELLDAERCRDLATVVKFAFGEHNSFAI